MKTKFNPGDKVVIGEHSAVLTVVKELKNDDYELSDGGEGIFRIPVGYLKRVEVFPKVYISGKISNLPILEVQIKFNAAESLFTAKGWQVVNPLKVEHNHGRTWNEYMVKDIEALMTCDTIAMLPCWKDSKGARIEHFIACEMGIKVLII